MSHSSPLFVAQSLISLNNEALGLFLEGRFTDALEILQHAYVISDSFHTYNHEPCDVIDQTLLMPPIHSPSEEPNFLNSDIAKSIHIQSSSSPPFPCQRELERKRKLFTSSFALSSGEGTMHSLYNRGLMLPVDPALTQRDIIALVTAHHHQTSAILLYNMALCYHNMGSHLGISTALLQALQLYEMALNSIDQGTDLTRVQKLVMAILNNCANIYTYYRRTEETKKCFENLKIVLAASTVDMAFDEDYDFFFLNAFFQSQELWFAPAA